MVSEAAERDGEGKGIKISLTDWMLHWQEVAGALDRSPLQLKMTQKPSVISDGYHFDTEGSNFLLNHNLNS